MLGLLVSELVRMVETRHGISMADALMFGTDVPARRGDAVLDGYPQEQIEVLIDSLALRTGESPRQLMRDFAARLMERIRHVHPGVYDRHADLFEPLAGRGEAAAALPVAVGDFARREMEILFGDRQEAQRLVEGLRHDIARRDLRAGGGRGLRDDMLGRHGLGTR